MIKNLLILIFSLSVVFGFAQNQGFSYQAVVRDNQGQEVVNKTIGLKVSIIEEAFNGEVAYSETHIYTTNSFGLVNLVIGQGIVEEGDFTLIDWGENTHFLKTELDINNTGDYEFLGITQLLSVPYALHAETATNVDDADADSTNEIQSISIEGNTLSLTDGGEVDLSHLKDADADSTNELQTISILNDTLKLTLGGNVDLSYLIDSDADSTNELQTVSISNDTLYLSQGNFVVLEGYLDNTDEQILSIQGNELIISNGNSVVLSGTVDLDADPINELQSLEIEGDSISITDGNSIRLPINNDNDSLNEIQMLSISNDTLYLEYGGFVKLPKDNDSDSTNEFQTLSLSDDSIHISNGNAVEIPISIPKGSLILSKSSNDTNLLNLGFELVNVQQVSLSSVKSLGSEDEEDKAYYFVNTDDYFDYGFNVSPDIEPIYHNGKIFLFGSRLYNDSIGIYNYIIDVETREVKFMDTSNIIIPKMAEFESVLAGDEIFYFGGRVSNGSNQYTWGGLNIGLIYNIPNDTFRLVATNFDLPARQYHSMNYYDGKVFIVGGKDGANNVFQDVAVYDIQSDSWESISSLPTKKYSHKSFIKDSTLICHGGFSSLTSGSDNIALYNFNSDEWESYHTTSNAGVNYVSPTILDEKLFVYSGRNASGNNVYDAVYFDLKNRVWEGVSEPVNMSTFARSGYFSHYIDSVNVLIYGGWYIHSGGNSDDAMIYNIEDDSWVDIESFFQGSTEEYRFGLIFDHGKKICYLSTDRNVQISCMESHLINAIKDTESSEGFPKLKSSWLFLYEKK